MTQVFTPDRGWKTYPINKRISGAWARQAKALGVTAVAVQSAGRIADFRIEELTRRG